MYFLSYANLKRITRFIYGVINLTNSQKCAKRWVFSDMEDCCIIYKYLIYDRTEFPYKLCNQMYNAGWMLNLKYRNWWTIYNIFFRSAPSSPDISPQSSPRPHRPSSDRLSILTKLVKKGEKKGLFVEKMPVRIYQVSHNYSSWIRC